MIKEDPYASMEKDQLISMIHFLVKREDEREQENQELKDMVKDLRDTHKQDVKAQSDLTKSIDRLTNQVADLTTQNKTCMPDGSLGINGQPDINIISRYYVGIDCIECGSR